MYYVYRYYHPDYPFLYVGITDNMRNRINSHEHNNSDNIPREYSELLRKSDIYYITLPNKHRAKWIESYLIDAEKPFLNKQEKNNCEFDLDLQINISWKKYNRNEELNRARSPQKHKISKLRKKLIAVKEAKDHNVIALKIYNHVCEKIRNNDFTASKPNPHDIFYNPDDIEILISDFIDCADITASAVAHKVTKHCLFGGYNVFLKYRASKDKKTVWAVGRKDEILNGVCAEHFLDAIRETNEYYDYLYPTIRQPIGSP